MDLKSLANFFNKIDLYTIEGINPLHVAEQKFFKNSVDYRQKAWDQMKGSLIMMLSTRKS